MNNKDLLYKKLNALRLEVHSSIVDDIVTTVDDLFSQPNGSKPLVSGALLPPDKIWLLKEIASSYIYETAEEGTYSIATQGIEKILEYYELQRQQ